LEHKFSLILGNDNMKHFHKWKNYEEILTYKIYVYPRKYSIAKLTNHNIVQMNLPLISISSTMVRERILLNKTIKYLIPELSRQYILKNKLYF